MSARNAFADAPNGTPTASNASHVIHEEPRPAIRRRTSEIPPSLWLPSTQAETSLEVDIMILDYLAFQATAACLASRRPDGQDPSTALRSKLQLINSFLPIFKARHAQYQPDAELRLRLLLLKMATLFTQRFTMNPTTPDLSSLQAMRDANRQRAEAWLNADSERRLVSNCDSHFALRHSIPLDILERNRASVLHKLGLPPEDENYEDAFYGTAACVSLLDLLPLFVELSAASSSIHGSSLTSRWTNLACEFMMQAFLEQFLVHGAKGSESLDQAFAWGYAEEAEVVQDGRASNSVAEINEMFEDDSYATEVEGWHMLKKTYVKEMDKVGFADHPDEDGDVTASPRELASNLEDVTTKHPVDAFEASILKFLDALSASIAQPVLVQLERGQLDGMSEDATKDFLAQCGVTDSIRDDI